MERCLHRGFLDFLFDCRPTLLRCRIILKGQAKEANQKARNRLPHATSAARRRSLNLRIRLRVLGEERVPSESVGAGLLRSDPRSLRTRYKDPDLHTSVKTDRAHTPGF